MPYVPLPSQRLRVMHLVYALRTGGMEAGVVKIVNGLDRSRFEASVCSCQPAGPLKRQLAPDVPLFELDRPSGNDAGIVRSLARLFRRERPDVLHTHAWGTLCEGVLAARLARVPFVVHGEHGTMELRRRNRWVQRFVWGRVDRVLSVSSVLADRMSREIGFPRDRIVAIRNGVDLERFGQERRATARRRLGLGDNTTAIGTVGRLVDVKDHSTFLAALACVKARGGRFRALIVGDGPLRGRLEALAAEYGVAGHVTFLGNREDVADLQAAFDLYVLSSKSEGLSNTLLEAMASGLPVVATRVGGNPELVTDGLNGLLVAPQRAWELGDAILSLVINPGRRRVMGAAARARAESDFSVDQMVGDYERLYLDVAAARERDGRP